MEQDESEEILRQHVFRLKCKTAVSDEIRGHRRQIAYHRRQLRIQFNLAGQNRGRHRKDKSAYGADESEAQSLERKGIRSEDHAPPRSKKRRGRGHAVAIT